MRCPFSNVSVPSGTNIDHLVCEIKHLKPCKLLFTVREVTESPSTTHFYLPRAGSWEQQKAIPVSGISARHQSPVSREPFLPKESSLIKDRGKEHELQLLAEPALPRAMPLHRALQTEANSTQHFSLKLNRKTSTKSRLPALVFC